MHPVEPNRSANPLHFSGAESLTAAPRLRRSSPSALQLVDLARLCCPWRISASRIGSVIDAQNNRRAIVHRTASAAAASRMRVKALE
jgi:hypothetical protein